MAEQLYFNSKYHYVKPDANPNSLFSSFNIFKSLGASNIIPYEQRPPYPILISNPSFRQVLGNLNKSDFLVYSSIFFTGFGLSILTTRSYAILNQKLFILHVNMHLFNLLAIGIALNCSYYRLIGLMDNGLRWKKKDRNLNKYDFTRDFEKHTIFKHLRERND
jgi:hypothetical protein